MWQSGPGAFQQVDVAGIGPVSLATLDELRDAGRADRSGVGHLASMAAEVAAQAEDRLADAGALLVPRREWWQAPGGLSPLLAEADRLVSRISSLDEAIADLEWRPGTPASTIASRLRIWTRGRLLGWERVRAGARLRETLIAVARAAARSGVDVPGVESPLQQAAELEERAEGLRAALATASSRLGGLERELRLREEAARLLGFDSLHLAAYFRAYGMPVIESPIALEADELAFLARSAELAGTRTTEGDRGKPIPTAYTGISYWIGAFRHRAIPLQTEGPIDKGTLVVTNRRLSFVGRTDPVSIPLAVVVNMDVYTDGLVVYQLGREHPDVFLVAAPGHVTFYMNWAMRTSQAL
jgi:hypothetical protein